MSNQATSQANNAETLRSNIVKLLDLVGRRSVCRECDRPIWFVRNVHGRFMLITSDAVNHFEDCKYADRLREAARKERDGQSEPNSG